MRAWSWVSPWRLMGWKLWVVCEPCSRVQNSQNTEDVVGNAPEAEKWYTSRWQEMWDCSALARLLLCPGSIRPPIQGPVLWSRKQPHSADSLIESLLWPDTSVVTRLSKYSPRLCWPTTGLPSHRAYLQLAIPFTFTQMPSFWQGFGSHGSLKYWGQLWSSMGPGPIFSTDRFCRRGCPWPRLPGGTLSNAAFPEPPSEACCSWCWRTRLWGISLVFLVGTSVWLRWLISWGKRQWVVRKIYD